MIATYSPIHSLFKYKAIFLWIYLTNNVSYDMLYLNLNWGKNNEN